MYINTHNICTYAHANFYAPHTIQIQIVCAARGVSYVLAGRAWAGAGAGLSAVCVCLCVKLIQCAPHGRTDALDCIVFDKYLYWGYMHHTFMYIHSYTHTKFVFALSLPLSLSLFLHTFSSVLPAAFSLFSVLRVPPQAQACGVRAKQR